MIILSQDEFQFPSLGYTAAQIIIFTNVRQSNIVWVLVAYCCFRGSHDTATFAPGLGVLQSSFYMMDRQHQVKRNTKATKTNMDYAFRLQGQ
jgi:hypothetical protein